MKCQVHYLDADGKPRRKEVVGEPDEARAVFEHLFPDCRIQKAVLITPAAPRARAAVGKEKWFHRGKEARQNGETRDRIDGRMSPENRSAFQAGWDEQENFMRPPSDEQRAESADVARRLRDWARANL